MVSRPIRAKIIRKDCLRPVKLWVTEAAKALACRVSPCPNCSMAGTGFPLTWRCASKGRLEHGGILAAQSADLRSLARQTARWPPQGDEVFDAGNTVKHKARRRCQPVNKDRIVGKSRSPYVFALMPLMNSPSSRQAPQAYRATLAKSIEGQPPCVVANPPRSCGDPNVL